MKIFTMPSSLRLWNRGTAQPPAAPRSTAISPRTGPSSGSSLRRISGPTAVVRVSTGTAVASDNPASTASARNSRSKLQGRCCRFARGFALREFAKPGAGQVERRIDDVVGERLAQHLLQRHQVGLALAPSAQSSRFAQGCPPAAAARRAPRPDRPAPAVPAAGGLERIPGSRGSNAALRAAIDQSAARAGSSARPARSTSRTVSRAASGFCSKGRCSIRKSASTLAMAPPWTSSRPSMQRAMSMVGQRPPHAPGQLVGQPRRVGHRDYRLRLAEQQQRGQVAVAGLPHARPALQVDRIAPASRAPARRASPSHAAGTGPAGSSDAARSALRPCP